MALDMVLAKENINERQLRKVLNQLNRETEEEASVDTMKSEYDDEFIRDRQQELSRVQSNDNKEVGQESDDMPFSVNLMSSGSKVSGYKLDSGRKLRLTQ